MSKLWVRARTALVFAIVMVVCIIWNVYSFLILMSVIIVFSLSEYFDLLNLVREKNKVSIFYKPISFVIGLSIFFLSLLVYLGMLPGITLVCIPCLLFLYFVLELFADSIRPLNNIGYHLLGIVWLVLPFAMLNLLVMHTGSYQWKPILGIIFLLWANDSFAYLIGASIGKHKFFKRISPGKTWEGIVGGMVGCMTFSVGLYHTFGVFNMQNWIVLGIIVSISATLGDLIESMFKRSLKIKDSGTLLPGHGGVLDRFDAFYFVIPFATLYVMLFAG